MNKEVRKLYTPIVLRTGFMHSYRRTISLLIVVIGLEAIFWTLTGLWSRFAELGPTRWGLIVIITLVVPLGIWTIRDIVASYENLFNVFDEKTEENMKLYQSMSQPSSETQERMHTLFKDEETYTSFQDEIRTIIFKKSDEISTIGTIIAITIFILYISFYEKIILGGAISIYPLSILEIAIDAFTSIFITIPLAFIFLFGIGYLRTMSRIGASQNDLSVWKYIQHLRGTPVKDAPSMSYWEFHDYASTIGQHFSGIAFRIVVLGVLGGLVQILYNTSTPTLMTWVLAIFPFVLSVLVLALPLNSLHRVMRDAKVAVLTVLEEEYDHLRLKFISYLMVQRHSGSLSRGKKENEDIAMKIPSLKGIIEETKLQWTWPVRTPIVLRIIATSMIPAFIVIIDLILIYFGLFS